MSSAKGPGDRIEARCTRCNDTTGHVIVAMVGGQIVKVECCACGSVHKFYPPKAEKALSDSGVRKVSAGGDRKAAMSSASKAPRTSATSKVSARAAAAAAANEAAWRAEMERPSAPAPRSYSMDMTLQKQDIVEHSVFGLGAVIATVKPDKAEILFREGVRVLRCCC